MLNLSLHSLQTPATWVTYYPHGASVDTEEHLMQIREPPLVSHHVVLCCHLEWPQHVLIPLNTVALYCVWM